MKLNPFERYTDIETNHLQVIFLKEILHLANKTIADITGYAVSTVRNYIKKFSDLLEKAKKVFSNGLEKAVTTAENVTKTIKARLTNCDKHIKWDVVPNTNPCGYILEFYDGDNLLWLKVGMTERSVRERIKEHLAYYGKKFNNLYCVVKALYEVQGKEDAEIIESALRDVYKRKYADRFIRNDRFTEIKYKKEELKDEKFNTFVSLLGAESAPVTLYPI